jgi:glutamate racemase
MIGVFDSGIGGLTLLHEIMLQLPNEQFCYYADTENVPYSTKSEEQIKLFVDKAINYFLERNVKAIVLACNTATNVCIEDLRKRHTLPIIAIQPAVKVAVDKDILKRKILVCATPITLRSDRFQRLLDSINANSLVERLALPELVKMAEKEQFDTIEAKQYLSDSLAQFDIDKFGSVVLGCTHFTYYEPIFQELAPHLFIYDGNEGTARHLKNILSGLNLLSTTKQNLNVDFIESGHETQNKKRFERYFEFIKKLNSTSN